MPHCGTRGEKSTTGLSPRPSGSAAAHDVMVIAHSHIGAALTQLDIMYLAVSAHSPSLDSVIVVDRSRATHGYQLCAAGLDIAGAVGDPGLQQCLIALPNPIKVESGQGLRQYWPL